MFMTEIPLVARYIIHFNEFLVGSVSAVGALATFVMSAFINSKLSSTLRRKVFIASSLAYALVFPTFYFSNSITIWPIVFVSGFVLGAIMPNIITSASLLPDRKARERVLSIYTLTLSISLVAGPAIEGYLLRIYPLLETFIFFSIFPALVFVTSFFIKFPEEQSNVKIEAKNVIKNHGFKVSVYNIMTYNIPFAFILTFGGIYARDFFGASYSTVTLMFSSFFFTSFISRLLLALKPPENLWRLMILSVLLTTVGLMGIVESPSLTVMELSMLILGFPHGFTYPLSVISISRAFDISSRNAANSLFFSIMMAIGSVMPFVSGSVVLYIGLKYSFVSVIPVILIILLLLHHEMKLLSIGKSGGQYTAA
ncbi:TVG1326678 [Thermoplasma volcanium GSS1]|uniref:TVG1326678 protein n=2 Tax=Thermoplasma volcanium TaxID=50339 RepID=Q978X8_THEVO|nr:TVG1326678 [Thermoplasma volcanium GSS1]